MLEHDEHSGLRDSGRRSAITYIPSERENYTVVCVALLKAELNLRKIEVRGSK
jgi:hypothetical protein